MEESPGTSRPPIEGDLWSRYPKPYDDVAARSSEVNLNEHLTTEEIEKLSGEAATLGLPNVEQFLKAQVMRLEDIREADENAQQVLLPDFIAQVLSAAQDGSYA